VCFLAACTVIFHAIVLLRGLHLTTARIMSAPRSRSPGGKSPAPRDRRLPTRRCDLTLPLELFPAPRVWVGLTAGVPACGEGRGDCMWRAGRPYLGNHLSERGSPRIRLRYACPPASLASSRCSPRIDCPTPFNALFPRVRNSVASVVISSGNFCIGQRTEVTDQSPAGRCHPLAAAAHSPGAGFSPATVSTMWRIDQVGPRCGPSVLPQTGDTPSANVKVFEVSGSESMPIHPFFARVCAGVCRCGLSCLMLQYGAIAGLGRRHVARRA
jgi:hypothetical protein